jgi:predicted transcriptional regulator
MKTWKQLKKELLAGKEVAKEYEKLQPRYEFISQLISKRQERGFTQSELAKKIGTKQSAIARLEAGNVNPSLIFLGKLAAALDMKLRVTLQ